MASLVESQHQSGSPSLLALTLAGLVDGSCRFGISKKIRSSKAEQPPTQHTVFSPNLNLGTLITESHYVVYIFTNQGVQVGATDLHAAITVRFGTWDV